MIIKRAIDGLKRRVAAWSKQERDIPTLSRFRELLSDPINLLIERTAEAGHVRGYLVTLHNGIRVPFRGPGSYYGSFSDILVMNRGVHEPLEEFVFQELLRILPSSASMVELGAYWGHYSMWLKARCTDASVTLVEPSAEHLDVGRANFARNQLEAASYVRALVGHNHWKVDEFLGKEKRLSVLHSDIQGFEVEMLKDADKSLDRKAIDYIFVSTHSQSLHDEVLFILRAAGYIIEVDADINNDTLSHDGLVFARSPTAEPVLRGFKPMGRAEIMRANPTQILHTLAQGIML